MNYVIAVSSAEALIYQLSNKNQLIYKNKLKNPIGRAKNSSLQNDQAGMKRPFNKGSTPYSLSLDKNPHEDAMAQFSARVANYIFKLWNQDKSNLFNVAASPKLVGMIKKNIQPSILNENINWITKAVGNIPTEKWPSELKRRAV